MRLRPGKLLGRLLGVLIVGGFVVLILVTLGAGVLGDREGRPEEKPDEVLPPSPVSVKEVHLESIEITYRRAGTIRPLRRFSLGFEIAGRVAELGSSAEGETLDEGDRVLPGHLLARLDDQVLSAQAQEARARLSEAKARQEQASSDLGRADRVRQRGSKIITDDQYQDYVTKLAVADAQVAVAEAQLKSALKNLDNTRLKAPEPELEALGGPVRPAGQAPETQMVLSRRTINVGESVNPQQVVMELLRVDHVLLVVGVPEANVGNIAVGQPAHVELLARDRFQRERPRLEGKVYRVAEAADDTTSLFEVEILLPNPDGVLKPGLIAVARIVVDVLQGFKVPLTSVVFRGKQMLLFTVGADEKARSFRLEHWIEQEGYLVLTHLPPEHHRVVVRGQHRLVEGRPVRREKVPDGSPVAPDEEIPVRAAAVPAS